MKKLEELKSLDELNEINGGWGAVDTIQLLICPGGKVMVEIFKIGYSNGYNSVIYG